MIEEILGTSAMIANEVEASSRQSLGQHDFLRMLIAQLENQDPLNPQDSTEFTAQLATFSSLEQLIAMREGIEALAARPENGGALAATSLIGKYVVAETSQFEWSPGSLPSLAIELGSHSDDTRVVIREQGGRTVATLDLGALSQGRHTVLWDGIDQGTGLPAEAGIYQFEVVGDSLSARTLVEGRVTGSTLGDSPVLMMGDVVVPIGKILEVTEGIGA